MKIYISGQITGLSPEEAKRNFARAEKRLEFVGLTPVNPMSIDPKKPNPTWEDFMVADIRELFKCDGIYMLKGWRNSKGARIEHAIALEMGMKMLYQTREYKHGKQY